MPKEIERERLKYQLNNPIVKFEAGVEVVVKDNGKTIEVWVDGKLQESRKITPLEHMFLIRIGSCEDRISLLVQNYLPAEYDPEKIPSKSINVDKLIQQLKMKSI